MEKQEPALSFRAGVRFGLGFSIPFAILYGVAITIGGISQRLITKELSAPLVRKPFGPDAKLKILQEQSQRTEYNFIVRGKVKNEGSDIWEYVRIEADLLDASGKLLKLCDSRVFGPLYPSDERFFEVDCEGSKDDPIPNLVRYEAKIVDASYKTREGT